MASGSASWTSWRPSSDGTSTKTCPFPALAGGSGGSGRSAGPGPTDSGPNGAVHGYAFRIVTGPTRASDFWYHVPDAKDNLGRKRDENALATFLKHVRPISAETLAQLASRGAIAIVGQTGTYIVMRVTESQSAAANSAGTGRRTLDALAAARICGANSPLVRGWCKSGGSGVSSWTIMEVRNRVRDQGRKGVRFKKKLSDRIST